MSDPRTSEECACKSKDARECYMRRYQPPVDDFSRSTYFEQLDSEGGCDCGCHYAEGYEDDDYIA